MERPRLGDRVREIVSDYTGIVTGECVYLWGCEQVLVVRTDEKGKPEGEWFDIGRIEVVEQGAASAIDYGVESSTGPDVPAPIR